MSDTPRTDALYASDFRRWEGWPPNAGYHRMTDLARELERELAFKQEEPELLKAIYRQSCEELRAENARFEDRLASLTDRGLPPDRRTLANYWEARYFAAWRETANANRGIARLQRRLEGAKERIASLNSDAAMLREENARLHARLITSDLDC